MANSIGTKMGNINGENVRMNYINVNHLVRLYDGVFRLSLARRSLCCFSFSGWRWFIFCESRVFCCFLFIPFVLSRSVVLGSSVGVPLSSCRRFCCCGFRFCYHFLCIPSIDKGTCAKPSSSILDRLPKWSGSNQCGPFFDPSSLSITRPDVFASSLGVLSFRPSNRRWIPCPVPSIIGYGSDHRTDWSG